MIEDAIPTGAASDADDYGGRLKLAMQQSGVTTTALANELGVSYQAVKRVLEGKSKAFSAINNEKAAIVLNVSAYWLASGIGQLSKNNVQSLQTPVYSDSQRKIWVIGKDSGGLMPERIWEDSQLTVEPSDYALLESSDPYAFLSEVVGDSMYPKFENRNFVLVEPSTEIEIEDCVLVRLKSGETMLKRLVSMRDGIRLSSFNDPGTHHYQESEVGWMYYVAHEVPRKKIRSRY